MKYIVSIYVLSLSYVILYIFVLSLYVIKKYTYINFINDENIKLYFYTQLANIDLIIRAKLFCISKVPNGFY